MSLVFVSGNTSSAYTVLPSIVMPFTIGAWVRGEDTGGCIFAVGAAAATQFFLWGTINPIQVFYWNGGASVGAITSVAQSNSQWMFCVMRIISATNRRISVLREPGGISHGQDTASVTPVTLANLSVGAARSNSGFSDYGNGRIAELFYCDSDIQADGGQLDSGLLAQLAYKGPFSVGHIAGNIVEYQSFAGGANLWQPGHFYQRGASRSWVVANAPASSFNPPIASDFVRPSGQSRRLLVI